MMAVMGSTLGTADRSLMQSAGQPAGQAAAVPPATRARPPGWRDPRMWVGLAIVAVSVLGGARLLAAADESVQVWTVTRPVAAGEPVPAGDLAATRVRFVEAGDLARYLPADEPLPAGAVLARSVGAGELLPRDALGDPADTGVARLPLSVPAQQVPPGLATGDRVDVWVSRETARVGEYDATLLLEDAEVVSVSSGGDALAPTTELQLVLGLDGEQQADLDRTLTDLGGGTVTVVARG